MQAERAPDQRSERAVDGAADWLTGDGVGTRRRRDLVLVPLIIVLVIGVVTAVKAVVEQALPTRGWRVGTLWVHVSHNPGVAFGVASRGPGWMVVVVPAVIVTGLLVAAWGSVRGGRRRQGAGLALAAGGGLANLLDRAPDRVVTDYLDLGWWPSFNLADATLVAAMSWLALQWWRTDRAGESSGAATRPDPDRVQLEELR